MDEPNGMCLTPIGITDLMATLIMREDEIVALEVLPLETERAKADCGSFYVNFLDQNQGDIASVIRIEPINVGLGKYQLIIIIGANENEKGARRVYALAENQFKGLDWLHQYIRDGGRVKTAKYETINGDAKNGFCLRKNI